MYRDRYLILVYSEAGRLGRYLCSIEVDGEEKSGVHAVQSSHVMYMPMVLAARTIAN
jgi:hypothetical protein